MEDRAAEPRRGRSACRCSSKSSGKPQMVLAGSKSVAAFDPHDRQATWVADSPTDKFVATVAYADGVIFATGTSPTNTLVGIGPTAPGT